MQRPEYLVQINQERWRVTNTKVKTPPWLQGRMKEASVCVWGGDPSGGGFIACVVMSSLKFLKLWDLLKRGELAHFSLPLPLTTVGILRLFLWILGPSEGDQRGQNQERPPNGLFAGGVTSSFPRDVSIRFFPQKPLIAICCTTCFWIFSTSSAFVVIMWFDWLGHQTWKLAAVVLVRTLIPVSCWHLSPSLRIRSCQWALLLHTPPHTLRTLQ